MMPRLIRRKPFLERLKDYLNPGDFLLWLSEEIETSDWDSKHFAAPVAFGLHVVFLVARANSGASATSGDDVFGDDYSGTGWLGYIATIIVHILMYASIANALFTFLRKKHYRLFEQSLDAPQLTPSIKRVRVDSSPVSSSPLRLLTSLLGDTNAQSRAHPDPTRDVWELAVWDPLPICLQLFCHFSPGHVLVYWLFLPTLASDPRPSVTVVTTILLEMLLSSQLYLLQSFFSQQSKDSTMIHREVMGEYDKKFVHPLMNPVMRDVATQYTSTASDAGIKQTGDVSTYTPTVVLKREFRTMPNPNYAKHIDPDNVGSFERRQSSPLPSYTPSAYGTREPTPFTAITPRPPIRQPQFRSGAAAVSSGGGKGDGGSLGVYSHVNSPLKKAISLSNMQTGISSPRNSHDMASREVYEHRERERSASPVKRHSETSRSVVGNSSASVGGYGAPSYARKRHSEFDSPRPSRF